MISCHSVNSPSIHVHVRLYQVSGSAATQRRRFAPRLSVALPSVKVDASPELRPAPERLSDYV